MMIKMLNKLKDAWINPVRISTKTENIKKNQTELKNTLTEIKKKN